MSDDFEQVLNLAIKAFEKQFNTSARRFGKKHDGIKGASDNAQGVQWNVAVYRDTNEIRLGVNLEGMTYRNWPITSFIQNELSQPSLIEIVEEVQKPEQVIVQFTRDAWQMASRPEIAERQLIHSGSHLNKLTSTQWHAMLSEALTCLDPNKNFRGRVIQSVTKRSGKAEMEVTPHLNIHTYLSYKQSNIDTALEQAHQNLKPIYEWAKQQAR